MSDLDVLSAEQGGNARARSYGTCNRHRAKALYHSQCSARDTATVRLWDGLSATRTPRGALPGGFHAIQTLSLGGPAIAAGIGSARRSKSENDISMAVR